MKFVIPSEDIHWEYRDHEVHEDDVMLAGGYAVAYMNRRDMACVYLSYEERPDDTGWFGYIHWTMDMPGYPTEVWQMAYELADDCDEPELTEHYNEAVAPLSDSDFLTHLAAYEAGAHDFIGSLEGDGDMHGNRIWSGVLPVDDAEHARRYLENTFTALSVDL